MDNEPRSYAPAPDTTTNVMSLGEWLLTIFICAIPCIGWIVALVWAFGSGGNPNRKNYARAYLILMLIGVVLSVLSSTFLMAAIAPYLQNFYY